MLRLSTFFVAVALSTALPHPAINVFEPILTPEEAQKYLNSPPFTNPQLSSRTAVLPLVKYNDPRFRSADAGPTLGHYWKNGHEIENTDDYVEEVYDASQYHGQDGLGAYVYGYQTPESSKQENRVHSGDVTGSYIFKAGSNNDLIKVRYWADSQGFHQEDNIPKVVLKPVEEAEDVRQARLAHEKAWKEAAAAALLNPNAQGLYNAQYDYQPAASAQQSVVVAPPEPAREAKAYPVAQAQASYQPGPGYAKPGAPEKYEEPEPTGPPHGFFYSFNYPVSIISPKDNLQGDAPSHQDFEATYAKSNA
ncbi:uncharacterized protein [Epargyreus clarus]|uniref:uncharacterized protein n=1 Tax=Epargyreus clarus TaxID=520877 RepID=UPI003C2CACCC